MGCPGSLVVKNLPANAGDSGSLPGSGRSLEKQIATHSVFLLDSHMDRVAWQATVAVQFSCSVASSSLQLHGLQHIRLPCPSPSPRVCSNSCPVSWWCHPIISSSVTLFSSCPQCFPGSGSFPVSLLFASGGQSIGTIVGRPGRNSSSAANFLLRLQKKKVFKF